MSSEAPAIVEEPSLRVVDLGKRYLLGHIRRRRESMKDVIVKLATGPLAALHRAFRPPEAPELWAVRNVSFEARRGEFLGVIGPNGAGKSTVLKLLARITRPSEGRIELRGRLCSLLEVGVGFHPELTGRDNITLSGVLLGMSRREVAAKFEEIVAFAGLDVRFIDTAVKHYSSGMYLRLGFAVAAHLDPDILVVDETLAVGDEPFQARCLAYMRSLAARGVTVLLVTHDLEMVIDLCSRALVMREGRKVFDGGAREAVAELRRLVAVTPPSPP